MEWDKFKRFEDLTEEEIQVMSLNAYEEYERERMGKNAWYVCRQVTMPQCSEEVFFFNSANMQICRNSS